MKATAVCPRCKQIVSTNDPYIVEQGESFHECRKGNLRWVKVKWKVESED